MKKLFCFGLGYSATVFAKLLQGTGWAVSGTTRTPDKAPALEALGFETFLFSGEAQITAKNEISKIQTELTGASHLLISIAPDQEGDPVLTHFGAWLRDARHLQWVGYLSTVGVYGDCAGVWVDETTPPRPRSERSKARLQAEQKWQELHQETGLPVHLFRLAGIYGPGRSALEKLISGNARRINKAGQVFNRIHVEDIAAVLKASIEKPNLGALYNVTDHEPAPPQDVVAYGASLLGVRPPPLIDFEDADLSVMAKSFYGENKRVKNDRILKELCVKLSYPTYREGLRALTHTLDRTVKR